MWFTEGIKQALIKSKTEKLLLFIYLEGKDDASIEMNSFLESNENLKNLIRNDLIALKLEEGSENAKMFDQIYPVSTIPSIYLISNQGVLLQKIFYSNKNELIDKIKLFLNTNSPKENKKSKELDNNQDLNKQNENQQEFNQIKNEFSASKSNDNQKDEIKSSASSKNENENKNANLMDKINKTRLELKEKNLKELEKQKKEELERIKLGKSLQEFKKRQKEQEYEELIKEREKAIKLNELERARILAQIKADHEERKEKFERERFLRQIELEKQETLQKNNLSKDIIEANEDEVIIQIKLPDASILIEKFNIHNQFREVVNFIQTNSQYKNFILAISYPKRNFDEQDFDKTFQELNLINSVVLLTIEKSNPPSNNSLLRPTIAENSFLSNYWFYISLFFNYFINFFKSITINPTNGNNTNNNTNTNTNNKLYPQLSNNNSSSSEEPINQEQKKIKTSKPSFDQEGNIFKFKNPQDQATDDDDNNTWNGNSTQQQ